jgi:hypothetical protein
VRLILVVPALVVPVALAAVIVLCRQLTGAAQGLHAELRAMQALVAEARSTTNALAAVEAGRRRVSGRGR